MQRPGPATLSAISAGSVHTRLTHAVAAGAADPHRGPDTSSHRVTCNSLDAASEEFSPQPAVTCADARQPGATR
jgi:hypothetical protein